MKKTKIIFLIYTLMLIFCILFKFSLSFEDIKDQIIEFRSNDYNKINLVLFDTIRTQLSLLNKWAIINLIANTIPFLFYGILFFVAFDIKFIKMLLINFIFILSLEIIQLYFYIGTFDVDDILLNIAFIIIGFTTVNIVYKIKPNS